MTPAEFDASIGDYAVGLLTGQELAAFEAAMAADEAFAERVRTFAARLQGLDETVIPAEVPTGLWARVEAGLAAAKPAQVVRTVAPPAWFAIAASLVVGVGLGFVAGRALTPETLKPVVIAVLLSEMQEPGAIVEAFANNSIHIVPLEDFSVPSGKILEVWTKPDETIGAVSLGRFPKAREIVLPGTNLPIPQGGQLYEITLEDAPGSATGKPTGPILFKGLAQAPLI